MSTLHVRISSDTNATMLTLSLEDEPMEDLGTQVSQRTNNIVDSVMIGFKPS